MHGICLLALHAGALPPKDQTDKSKHLQCTACLVFSPLRCVVSLFEVLKDDTDDDNEANEGRRPAFDD